MDSKTFWDRRVTTVILGLFCSILAVDKIAISVRDMIAAVPKNPASILIFMGSIAPLLIGFAVTSFAAYEGKLQLLTWHNINNMFAGLLGGYFMYLFGISAFFTGSATNLIAGGIIAGIGATLAAVSLYKWP